MSRTMGVVWLLAVVLVALPISYERLAVVFGATIAQAMMSMVVELFRMQALFVVGGTVVVGLVAAGTWLYEHHPALFLAAGPLLAIALAMFRLEAQTAAI